MAAKYQKHAIPTSQLLYYIVQTNIAIHFILYIYTPNQHLTNLKKHKFALITKKTNSVLMKAQKKCEISIP